MQQLDATQKHKTGLNFRIPYLRLLSTKRFDSKYVQNTKNFYQRMQVHIRTQPRSQESCGNKREKKNRDNDDNNADDGDAGIDIQYGFRNEQGENADEEGEDAHEEGEDDEDDNAKKNQEREGDADETLSGGTNRFLNDDDDDEWL